MDAFLFLMSKWVNGYKFTENFLVNGETYISKDILCAFPHTIEAIEINLLCPQCLWDKLRIYGILQVSAIRSFNMYKDEYPEQSIAYLKQRIHLGIAIYY